MSDSEQAELKAGHPPAMKVGGKRVPLPKHHEEKAEAPKVVEESEEKEKPKTVVISGAQVKEKEVFSPEAARAIHEKPVPTHNHDAGAGQHGNKINFIQQPRKQ
ncbi:death-associated protein 1-like [Daphnia pulex]|uniref:death-associated protein 1-like n=1 Tax=Daphnia pulex TaxID=6669 RepID=UPI001EDD59A8|nr:death-associated protein 1-like [Daphnia pulex]XP_046443170.1 death-associated protein 1-like [Daphnia pulex]XP_046443171.1 death-associated protein 1-like [Daphnia pulex]